jgi:hypothetical protein
VKPALSQGTPGHEASFAIDPCRIFGSDAAVAAVVVAKSADALTSWIGMSCAEAPDRASVPHHGHHARGASGGSRATRRAASRSTAAARLQALGTDDPILRGTALEYLDGVLPPRIREPLWPFLELDPRDLTVTRSPRNLVSELKRSHPSILEHRSARRGQG